MAILAFSVQLYGGCKLAINAAAAISIFRPQTLTQGYEVATLFTMPDFAQQTESLAQPPSQDAEADQETISQRDQAKQETTSQRDLEGNSFGLRGLITRGSAARSSGRRISELQGGLAHGINLELLEPWLRRILIESEQEVGDAKDFLRNEPGVSDSESDSESDRLAKIRRIKSYRSRQYDDGSSREPGSEVPEIDALSSSLSSRLSVSSK